jgi:RHS repeat-associated protein
MILRDRDADENTGNGLEERLYVQQDANWNVTAIVGLAGRVLERYGYDPYGSITVYDGSFDRRGDGSEYAWIHNHQGGRFEMITGLYHFRYREYSATLGRWGQVDPIAFRAGDVSLYRAYGNNPQSRQDALGQSWDSIIDWVMGSRRLKQQVIWGTVIYIDREASIAKAKCCYTCNLPIGGYFFFDGGASDYGIVNIDRESGNALLHCTMTCIAAKTCGYDCARAFWTWRENNSPPLNIDNHMDLANNEIGYAGRNSPNCVDYCRSQLRAGNLKCIEGRGKDAKLVPCKEPNP